MTDLIAKAKKEISQRKRCMFVIYFENELIGSTSFYDIKLNHLSMSIGYTWLHPNYWGHGINQTIKTLMLKYVFEQFKFRRIAFSIDTENLRSRHAVEKMGIPFEGILRKHLVLPDGSVRDSALYAITDDVWAAKNIT